MPWNDILMPSRSLQDGIKLGRGYSAAIMWCGDGSGIRSTA